MTVKVEMIVTNFGRMLIEVDTEVAPITAANFLQLVDKGFYNGLTFHRIVPKFVIQGGCPLGTGTGGSGKNIKGEFKTNGWDNPIKHTKGILSMARSQDYNSASSQFFIMVGDAPHLDGNYAAFGKVIEGYEVADTISKLPHTGKNLGLEPVIIERVARI
jgi:peptidyl-prolyl cis-trans isomerase B (cyclophilin B)